jgi:xylan 1,4-beta-xylosidase
MQSAVLHSARCLAVAALLSASSSGRLAAQAADPPAGADRITIDASGPSHAFPHFWERIFGSGRASLTLRESYRNDLRNLKSHTAVQYIRFHNILSDETGLYELDANGLSSYNFSYIDQIYDGLLDNGVKPFFEISFMPGKLAMNSKPHPFWYKPLPSPPNDYRRWDEMILALMRHLVDRYGLGEVATWYFEVWNEPNIDFWNGNPQEQTYYELYDHTASSIKAISPKLRVGGPATAQAAWVDRFLNHCAKNKIPVDFVSTHVYGNESPKDVFGTDEKIGRSEMVIRSVRKVYDQVKHSPLPNVEIYWSEYNATYMNEVEVTDSPFMGPWLAHTIAESDGLVTAMSYWTFSDVFEEQGVVKSPFYGGYGMIAAGGIPKAAFNDFMLLSRLGTDRIENASKNTLVTKRADGSLSVALWNYAEAEEEGAPRSFTLDWQNLPATAKAVITIVDRDHGSPLRIWKEMGSPRFPTREEQARLRQAGVFPEASPVSLAPNTTITLAPKALALIEVSR